jgi:hypothetical protein
MPDIRIKWVEYLTNRIQRFKNVNPEGLVSQFVFNVRSPLVRNHKFVIEIITEFKSIRVISRYNLSYSMRDTKLVSCSLLSSFCHACWVGDKRTQKTAFEVYETDFNSVHSALLHVCEHAVRDTCRYILEKVKLIGNEEEKHTLVREYPALVNIVDEITPEFVRGFEPQWICEIAMPVAEVLAKKTKEIEELRAFESKRYCDLSNKYFDDTNNLRGEIKMLKTGAAPENAQIAELTRKNSELLATKDAEIAELKKKVSDAQSERKNAVAAAKAHWEKKVKVQEELKTMELAHVDQKNALVADNIALERELHFTQIRLGDTHDLMHSLSYNYRWMEARMNLATSQLESQPRPLKRTRSSSF